ncbi:MAG: MFS transporter [Marinilabilia sp.]
MAETEQKLTLKEKIGYALGDTAANLAWRSLTTFLMVFYTDVFGITAAAAGLLLLITRLSDGITDVIMGMIADRTTTRYGKFRPWILWTIVPFGLLLALTFSTPDFSNTGKIVYAYVTYILLTLVYTANNVPYSALMGVMTSNHKERTALSSYRFAGAYLGGLITQGFLLYLVVIFGTNMIDYLLSLDFSSFIEAFRNTDFDNADFDKKQGYQTTMYLFAGLLMVFLFLTFRWTRERVRPVQSDDISTIKNDIKDLIRNKAWILLLCAGFLFVVFNSIKQGVTVYYFDHFIGRSSLAATYMIVLLVVSMIAALVTSPMANFFGKKTLFLMVLVFATVTNTMIYFLSPNDVTWVFVFGLLSEFGAGILPVLYFSMLADSADYSEWKNGRRATGLVYSAGTFAMKFGGGVAGAIIGLVLSIYGYDGQDPSTVEGARQGIRFLMSWIPGIFTIIAFIAMMIYPLSQQKMDVMQKELEAKRNAN